MQIYLDSAALFLLASNDERRNDFLRQLEEWIQSDGKLFTSVIAIEALFLRMFDLEQAELVAMSDMRSFLHDSAALWKEILPLTPADMGRALELQQIHALRPAVAMHAAIALNNGIDRIASNDTAYRQVTGLRFWPILNDSRGVDP